MGFQSREAVQRRGRDLKVKPSIIVSKTSIKEGISLLACHEVVQYKGHIQFLIQKGAPMFSILRFRKRKEKKPDAVTKGWNACLEAVQDLIREHKWVVDEDEPQEIFCDVCGQSFMRALEDMRR